MLCSRVRSTRRAYKSAPTLRRSTCNEIINNHRVGMCPAQTFQHQLDGLHEASYVIKCYRHSYRDGCLGAVLHASKCSGPIKPNVNLIRHTGSLFIIKNCYISFTGMAFSFRLVVFFFWTPPRAGLAVRRRTVCVVCAHLGVGVGFDAICMSHALCCAAGAFCSIGLVTHYTPAPLLHWWAEYVSATRRLIFRLLCLCFVCVCIFYKRKIKYVLFRMERKIKGGSKSTRFGTRANILLCWAHIKGYKTHLRSMAAVVLLWVKVWLVLGTKDTVPAVCLYFAWTERNGRLGRRRWWWEMGKLCMSLNLLHHSIGTSNRSEIVGWEKHLFYYVNACWLLTVQWHYANWIEIHRLHDSSNYY